MIKVSCLNVRMFHPTKTSVRTVTSRLQTLAWWHDKNCWRYTVVFWQVEHVTAWARLNRDQCLSPPERLCQLLSSISNPSVRLAALRLAQEWPSRLEGLEKPLVEFTAACKNILNSKKLTSILHILLIFGNHINAVSDLDQNWFVITRPSTNLRYNTAQAPC